MHTNGLLYVLEKMVGNFKILFDNFSIFTRPVYTTIYVQVYNYLQIVFLGFCPSAFV